MAVLGDALASVRAAVRGDARAQDLGALHLSAHVVLAGVDGPVPLEVGVAEGEDVLPAGVVALVQLVELPGDGLALHQRPEVLRLLGGLELVPGVLLRHMLVHVLLGVDDLELHLPEHRPEPRQEVQQGHLHPRPPGERHDEDVGVERSLRQELHRPLQQPVQQGGDERHAGAWLQLGVQGGPPVHAAVPPDPGGGEDGVVPIQEQ
mmetsp:Transcript_44745/g.139188  ORF Transcript_44745/g.139188 Transcript_44745/m.139188 type:complete len:206 (+) Transcript_44745:315-932(+)